MKKLILLALLAASCATFQVKETFRVDVQVLAKENLQPLQGATVSCNGRVMITGPDGKAFFAEVPVGLLKLYARKNGYWDSGLVSYRETKQDLKVALVRKEQ